MNSARFFKKALTRELLLLILITLFGLFLRIYGLKNNPSFWSDEAHVAIFSRAIVQRGTPTLKNGFNTGLDQFMFYWLTAIPMKIFGGIPFFLRIVSVILGTLTIPASYLMGKLFAGKKVGLVSATIISLLTIEILWSRQLRPYQTLQLFYLLSVFFSYKAINQQNPLKHSLISILFSLLALTFHGLGLIILINNLVIIFFYQKGGTVKKLIPIILLLLIPIIILFLPSLKLAFSNLTNTNNVYFYKHFLLNKYFIITGLAFLAIIFMFSEKKIKDLIIFGQLILSQLIICCFILSQPFTRYAYIIFPFTTILTAYALVKISGFISPKKINSSLVLIMVLSVFLFFSKNIFSFYPKGVYSLNQDMSEIPEVNWQQIY